MNPEYPQPFASTVVKLLVVDDDDVDYKHLQRSLKRLKINNPTLRARDGQEALDVLRSASFQGPFVILLDLNMPRMNGIEFLEEVRSDPLLKPSIVFVLTTSSDTMDIQKTYDFNVAGYFVKDSPSDSIEKVIEVINGYWQIVVLPETA